jgi:outer membrane protein OmpA-like peptidoglycan-associated protein
LIFTKDAKFEFFIRPDLPNEDYDFSIFKINGDNYCDSIATNKILPVRSNICRKKPEERSVTGLKDGYDNYFAAAGESPSFSAPLLANAGEEYYLIIDGPYGTIGGFQFETIYLETTAEDIVDIIEIPEVKEPLPKIHISAVDQAGAKIENPSLEIKGARSTDSIYNDNNGDWTIKNVRKLTRYNITLTCKGYEQETFNYFHKIIGDSTLIFTLKKLTIGSKLKFEHITFIGDQATILPASEGDLKLLTSFLKENPHINVEIGGHVNGKGRNKRKFKKLSKERAKAIVDYLVNKNIKPTQLTYVGYGNSKIIYKNPYTEKESTANRRVEVIVTSIQ